MPKTKAKGYLGLELAIGVLAIILLVSILYPKHIWTVYDERTNSCRERIKNLNEAVVRFNLKNGVYPATLDTVISFIRGDSMRVPSMMFDKEIYSPDSMMVGFQDLDHIDRVSWTWGGPDSVCLTLVPKPAVAALKSDTLVIVSTDSIFIVKRGLGEIDPFIYVTSDSPFTVTPLKADSTVLMSKDYLLSLPPDSLNICPTTRTVYDYRVRIDLTLNAAVEIKRGGKEGVPLAEDGILTNIYLDEARYEATKLADRMIEQDSAWLSQKDSLIFAGVKDFLALRKQHLISQQALVTTRLDSLPYWSSPVHIKEKLFGSVGDLTLSAWTQDSLIYQNLGEFLASEIYEVTRIDTLGFEIGCPIDSVYYAPKRGIFTRIFGLGPEKDHGFIKDGEISWKERKKKII